MIPRVVSLGLSCLDYRFQLMDDFSVEKRRHPARSYHEALGGPAAVAAQAVARCGGRVSLWSRRGDDAPGAKLAQLLGAEGVDLSGFRVFPGARSPVCAVVILPGGERLLFPFWGESLGEDSDWLPVEELRSCGAVLADVRWPSAAARVLQAARELRIPAIVDLDRNTPEAWTVAEYATHVIADEDLAKQTGDPKSLIHRFQQMGTWAAVTLGPQGVKHPGGRLPAFHVEVRDSTGAGDVFHGAFALALAQRKSEEEALRFASAAGALRCQLGDVPDHKQVIEFLSQNQSQT